MELQEDQIIAVSKNISMSKVLSSNVSAVGYDDTNRLLKVIFKGNSSYIYSNVEPEIYKTIINSASVGKTLNECVVRQKDKYKYIKL